MVRETQLLLGQFFYLLQIFFYTKLSFKMLTLENKKKSLISLLLRIKTVVPTASLFETTVMIIINRHSHLTDVSRQ